jgi:hypothetical protein
MISTDYKCTLSIIKKTNTSSFELAAKIFVTITTVINAVTHAFSNNSLSPTYNIIWNRGHLDTDLANRIFHDFGTFPIYYRDGCSVPRGSDTNLHDFSFKDGQPEWNSGEDTRLNSMPAHNLHYNHQWTRKH